MAFALLAFATNGKAQTNLPAVSFNAICTSTNSTGFVQQRVTDKNLIDNCAVESGLSNLDGLTLVFDPTNFSVEVLGTNGAPLCTSLTFPGGLTFTNITTNITHSASNATTQIVFQRNVLVETNLTSSGVISGTASWKGTNMSAFNLDAILLYTEPVPGTNTPEICRAFLRAGNATAGREGDEDGNQHSGNQQDNGNHFGWQNPHNPHSQP